jgi:hypothetical protein
MGMREAWLDRLFAAHEADAIPYIESLADSWGELCGSAQLASDWADRLLEMTRLALSPDKRLRGHYHGTTACLSALLRAGRYGELEALLEHASLWHDRRYAVRALAAKGEPDAAIALAESSRDQWTSDASVDRLCESILRDAGRLEEAYRYGLLAHRATTHLATFRAIARAYPGIPKAQVLADLVRLSPGEEGKWFAAAKELKLYDEALRLARQSPTDPKTLARAARDFAAREPEFARGAGLLALYWLSLGQGYDITSLDVWMAYRGALDAAARLGQVEATRKALRTLLEGTAPDAFVRQLLRRELDLP